jgi:hypothetical protein
MSEKGFVLLAIRKRANAEEIGGNFLSRSCFHLQPCSGEAKPGSCN